MTRTEWRAFIRREIVLFIQYAVIASLAASVAHGNLSTLDRWEVFTPFPVSGPPEDIHPAGIISVWITRFWSPWFKAFLPLAMTRLFFVSLARWYRGRTAERSGETVQASAVFKIRHEIRLFLYYFLVSFAALTSVLVFYIQDSRHNSWAWWDRVPRWLSGEAGVFEVVSILAERFYWPGFSTFVVLALARLLAVFVVRKLLPRRNPA